MSVQPQMPLRPIILATAVLTLFVLVISIACWRTDLMGDDFSTPMYWKLLADRHGIASLFLPPQAMRYRPLEAVSMYLTQVIPIGSVLFRVHVLHFVSFAAFLFAMMNFARHIGLSKCAVLVAGAACALHPTQIACYGGLDNYSVHALFAIMFAGMTCLIRRADRPIAIVTLTFFTTLLASCFKEYGFGTFFFAPLVVWCFGTSNRFRNASIAAASAFFAIVVHQGLKHLLLSTVIESETPSPFKPLAALQYNVALYGSGSMFFGSTLDLLTRGGLIQKLILAGLVGLLGLVLIIGLWGFVFVKPSADAASPPATSLSPKQRLLFVVALFVPVTMPNLILMRVSEVYLPGVVAVLSMLIGLAWVGAQSYRSVLLRHGTSAALVVLFGFGVYSTFGKAAALKKVGERSAVLLDALDAAIPASFDEGDIGVLYPPDSTKGYSVYQAPDGALLSEKALWWKRPSSRVSLVNLDESTLTPGDLSRFVLVLKWSPETRRFLPLRPPTVVVRGEP